MATRRNKGLGDNNIDASVVDMTEALAEVGNLATMGNRYEMDEDGFDDLVIVDDGEGFLYAHMAEGVVLRGQAVSVEDTQYGATLVYRTHVPTAVTKKEGDEKVGAVRNPGELVRLGHRAKLEPIFAMIDRGILPKFEIKVLGKVGLEGGKSMWRMQIAVQREAIASMSQMRPLDGQQKRR